MDYPKLISEKWNLTAKFNCLQAIYFDAPSALAVPMCGEDGQPPKVDGELGVFFDKESIFSTFKSPICNPWPPQSSKEKKRPQKKKCRQSLFLTILIFLIYNYKAYPLIYNIRTILTLVSDHPCWHGSYQQQASSSCGSPMQSLCIKFRGIFFNSQSNMFRLWIYICQ